jgi:hypothetical protein
MLRITPVIAADIGNHVWSLEEIAFAKASATICSVRSGRPAMQSASSTPLEQLHGDERAPITFVDLIGRADVGVIEGRGRGKLCAFRGRQR